VSVLLGNGIGTFQAQQTVATGTNPNSITISDVNCDGRADVIVANLGSNTVSVLLGNSCGDFVGQTYILATNSDTVAGTAGVDQVSLARDPDGTHIDWTLGSTVGQIAVNDPNGLTINGAGGNDVITLDYSNGNPLPNTIHLNGTFTVNGLSGATPLAGTNLEIGRSTVWVSYSGVSPVAAIRAALAGGYNGGAWNGTSANGAITSTAAAGNSNHNTGIGWADSADGTGVNMTANTIELKYTLYGDTNLNGVVDVFDLNNLLPNFNKSGDWTGGDFNYSGTVDIFDLNAMLPNFNTSLGSQVQGATAAVATSHAGMTEAGAGAPVITAEAVGAAAQSRDAVTGGAVGGNGVIVVSDPGEGVLKRRGKGKRLG
jgi:hypothetical protein